MDSKFPVEIEVGHQKLSKIEAEFESIFQFIEHECDVKDIFDDTVLNGRAKLTSLKLEYSVSFILYYVLKCVCVWGYLFFVLRCPYDWHLHSSHIS